MKILEDISNQVIEIIGEHDPVKYRQGQRDCELGNDPVSEDASYLAGYDKERSSSYEL